MLCNNKVAVISTGNGGQSMAAYFASLGAKVSLYARESDRVEMFRTNIFHASGVINSSVKIDSITCNMQEAIKDAHLIMVTTPSQYHSIVAMDMAPYLADGQAVVLNPGRTFGTYEFENTILSNGCTADVLLGEADTFIFTCRCIQLGYPKIYSIKTNVLVGAHEKRYSKELTAIMQRWFPNSIQEAQSVLHTGITNLGMIFHPVPFLMNLTRSEAGEKFLYYMQAISPLVASILERMDEERLAVAHALGVSTPSVQQWLTERYGSQGHTLYETIQNTSAYSEVYTPTDIYSRYVFEDVPTGCVPMYCVGKALGIDMPVVKSVIDWASSVYGIDFYAKGRNREKMDLDKIIKAL